MARARSLAGLTLRALADATGHQLPPDTTRAKGWVGQVVEDALGAAAGSRAVPDFEALGIELKTVPIDARGRPRESTYVTTLPLAELRADQLEQSSLRKKLARVLFIPVEASPELPLSVRRVGSPLLWTPSPEDFEQLDADWTAFAELVEAGRVEDIGPELGEVLQVRPKGANAAERTWAPGPDGVPIRTMRRGLYLRPRFVHALFLRSFHMPAPSA